MKKMRRKYKWLDSFIGSLVWEPGNTDPDDDDRWGPMLWYPLFDVFIVLLGLAALTMGSPLLNRLFPVQVVDVGGVIVTTLGIICLIGVLAPKLGLLELIGKVGIVFVMCSYAGTVWAFSPNAGENAFVVIALFLVPLLLGPRVTTLLIKVSRALAAERRERKALEGKAI